MVTAGKELVPYASLPHGPERGQGRPGGLPVVRDDKIGQG